MTDGNRKLLAGINNASCNNYSIITLDITRLGIAKLSNLGWYEKCDLQYSYQPTLDKKGEPFGSLFSKKLRSQYILDVIRHCFFIILVEKSIERSLRYLPLQ